MLVTRYATTTSTTLDRGRCVVERRAIAYAQRGRGERKRPLSGWVVYNKLGLTSRIQLAHEAARH